MDTLDLATMPPAGLLESVFVDLKLFAVVHHSNSFDSVRMFLETTAVQKARALDDVSLCFPSRAPNGGGEVHVAKERTWILTLK